MTTCAVCGRPVRVYPWYGCVHLLDGEPVFPACNEGAMDPTGHVPVVATPVDT